jgi:heptosyltransferase II
MLSRTLEALLGALGCRVDGDPAALESPSSILVLGGHWIGDSLWAAQLIPALRARWPHASLRVVCKPATVWLWSLSPGVEIQAAPELISDRRRERVSLPRLWALGRALRCPGERLLVLDLMGNRYSALVGGLARPGAFVGFGGGELGGLYSLRIDAEVDGRHLSERPWRLVEALFDAAAPPWPRLPETGDPGRLLASLGLDPERPLAVLVPGAGWAAKRWPVERFAGLARALDARGYLVVTSGGRSERALCEAVLEGVVGGRAHALAGLPLDQLCSLFRHARLAVTNDSGPGHLAAAAGCRCLMLFVGETDPELYGGLGPRVTNVDLTRRRYDAEGLLAMALKEGPRSERGL